MKFITLVAFTFFFLITETNGQNLIWAQTYPGKIVQADIDGNNRTTLLAESRVRYHILDTANAKIYWSDFGQNKVFFSDLDGSNVELLISNLSHPAGLCIHDNSLYLVDNTEIKKYSLDGVFQETIHTGLTKPSDIVIHQLKMYWGDLGDQTIKSSLLDGTQLQTLVTDAYAVTDIEINHVTNKLFWVQSTSSSTSRGVYSADLDGSNSERLINKSTNGMTLDAENNKVYWSESILNNVFVVSLDDLSTPTKLFDDLLTHPTTITINQSTGKVYVANNEEGGLLFQGSLSSPYNKPIIFTTIYNPTRFSIDTINQKIYWINGKSWQGNDQAAAILRADLDGNNIQKLFEWPNVKDPSGVTIDIEANKIFWTDYNKKNISSSDLDGSNISEIVSGISFPRGIYAFNNQIYWSNGSHAIHRANYDGSDNTELINGLSNPQEINISASTNQIFWTDKSDGTISKANLDGSDITIIAAIEEASSLFLDDYHQQIYATSRYYNNSSIFKVNYDSTAVHEITDENLGTIEHIVVLNPELIVGFLNNLSVTDQMTVSPNPFNKGLTIQSNQELIRSVSVYNTVGIEVFQESAIMKNIHSIALNNIPSGIYWVKIEDALHNFEIKKLIKF